MISSGRSLSCNCCSLDFLESSSVTRICYCFVLKAGRTSRVYEALVHSAILTFCTVYMLFHMKFCRLPQVRLFRKLVLRLDIIDSKERSTLRANTSHHLNRPPESTCT